MATKALQAYRDGKKRERALFDDANCRLEAIRADVEKNVINPRDVEKRNGLGHDQQAWRAYHDAVRAHPEHEEQERVRNSAFMLQAENDRMRNKKIRQIKRAMRDWEIDPCDVSDDE